MAIGREKQIQRLLRWFQGGLIVAAIWLVASGLFFADEIPAPNPRQVNAQSNRTQLPDEPKGEKDYSSLWKRNLQETLIEIPEKVKKEEPAPTPKPIVLPKLLATFVEGKNSWALFLGKNGARRVRGVGQRVEGFMIVEIQPGVAHLKASDRVHELKIPRKQRTAKAYHQRRG